MRTPNIARTAAAGIVLALSLAACGSGSTSATTGDATGDAGLTGSILISGSSTVEPISSEVAFLFQEANPGVDITVSGPGTGDGFKAFCAGETDISDASRQIKESELKDCTDAGIEFIELKVGIDGLSILTNPANDAVECLDFAALYALTGPESEGFTTWAAAEPLARELGSKSMFPDASLQITGPGEESGTYDTYVEFIVDEFNEDRGTESQTRPDYTPSANDNVIIQGIEGSDTSLGWVGYAFYVENVDRVKALAVDGGDGCVAPDEETIASGTYPLARDLYIYVNTAKADANPALASFVDFYLGDDGYAAVTEVGYVALPEAAWTATVDAWDAR